MVDDSDGARLVGGEVLCGLGKAVVSGLAHRGEQGCAVVAGDEPAHGGHFLACGLVCYLALDGQDLRAQREAALHRLDARALDAPFDDLAVAAFRFA